MGYITNLAHIKPVNETTSQSSPINHVDITNTSIDINELSFNSIKNNSNGLLQTAQITQTKPSNHITPNPFTLNQNSPNHISSPVHGTIAPLALSPNHSPTAIHSIQSNTNNSNTNKLSDKLEEDHAKPSPP
eukprot:188937_1